ncbi:MAG: HU family DNA-binding protein [Pseudomonadota bacterium]
MVKSELIETLAEKASIPPKIAEIAVNTVFDSMTEALIKGDGIEIRGFGSFKVREYKGRTGNHPRTGITIAIPEKRRPFFKVGKELKERINKEPAKENTAENQSI